MDTTSEQVDFIMNVDLFDGDFADIGDRILSDKFVNSSRKEFECCICREIIPVKSAYRNITHVCDGELLTNKYCAECLLQIVEEENLDCEEEDETE